MNTKRMFGVFVLGLFLVSMMGGVLATNPEQAGEDLKNFLVNVGEGGSGFFSALFGDIAFGEGELLTSFFFAILLGMIIFSVISTFLNDTDPKIQWVITIAITVISFISIPAGYLESLRISYGAMGLSILTIIPFMVIFWFSLQTKALWIARSTWAFFSFYYFALAIGKWFDINRINELAAANPDIGVGISPIPYVIVFAVGIFMFFFIPQIRKLIRHGKMESYVETAEEAIKRHAAIQKLSQQSNASTVGASMDSSSL